MNPRYLTIAGMIVGAAAVAGCSNSQDVHSCPAEGESRVAICAAAADESPSEPATTATTRFQRAPELDNARDLIKDGKKFEARTALTKLILPAADGPARDEMRQMLDEINKELFFSRKPSPDCIKYEIQDGDTLAGIAKKQGRDIYFTQVFMLVNGISDARRIRARQMLKIPQGTFSAVVQKHAHRLIILLNGDYIREYPVALGAPESPTPEGKFVFDISKAIEPTWTSPDGKLYKFGDPNNILGTRWMGFKDTEEHHGLGVHGTSDPASVGKDVSNGCVRMLNHDVEEIFGMLAPDDTVEITK